MAFSGLVYRKRGRDPSPWFYVAPPGLGCLLLLLPRAMPWASIFRPFGAERNSLYSNSENGLVLIDTSVEETRVSGKRRRNARLIIGRKWHVPEIKIEIEELDAIRKAIFFPIEKRDDAGLRIRADGRTGDLENLLGNEA